MMAYLLGGATLILLVLILWRRASPEFRRQSEQPKFQFLSNLGFRSQNQFGSKSLEDINSTEPWKGNDEQHQP